jgi:hypothetical protein
MTGNLVCGLFGWSRCSPQTPHCFRNERFCDAPARIRAEHPRGVVSSSRTVLPVRGTERASSFAVGEQGLTVLHGFAKRAVLPERPSLVPGYFQFDRRHLTSQSLDGPVEDGLFKRRTGLFGQRLGCTEKARGFGKSFLSYGNRRRG